ncbi:MAG: leucyl/phenylalanyl-tRNA--protein transferase [Dermatophilaceae bacterium]
MSVDLADVVAGYATGHYLQDDGPGRPLTWMARELRGVVPLDNLRVSRSVARREHELGGRLVVDGDFAKVVRWCAEAPRAEGGVWLTDRVVDVYLRLHAAGLARSFELRRGDSLLAAEFAVTFGRVAFAESATHTISGSGNVCSQLTLLWLRANGFKLYDIQRLSPYMERFGAVAIPRHEYEVRLRDAMTPEDVVVRQRWN